MNMNMLMGISKSNSLIDIYTKLYITLDVDLGGRHHASPNEIKILGDLLGVKIPPLPKDAIISNKVPLGTLFADNKAVLIIILSKKYM
jgi:hypothetical protein